MKKIKLINNISTDRLPQHHELSEIKTLAVNSKSRLDYVQNSHSARSDLNEIINLIEEVEDEIQKLRMYKTNVADTFAGLDKSMLQSKIEKLKEMFKSFNISFPFIAPGVGTPLQGAYSIIGNTIVQSQFDQFIGSYEQGQTERLKRIAQILINGPSVSIPNAVINKLYEEIKAIPSCVAVHDYLREHPEISALIPTLMLNELPKDVQLDASRIRFEWNEERKQKIREEYIERKKRETEYWKAYEEAVARGMFEYEGDGEIVIEEVNPIKETMTNVFESYNKFASRNILPELPDVTAIGLSGDLIASTGSAQFVFDKAGNFGVVFSGGMKGKTDFEGGISGALTVSYDMECAKDMDGVGAFWGSGVDFGEVLAISGDYSYGTAQTEDGRQVSTHSLGVGVNGSLIPAEIHTGVTNTKTFTINVYDIANDIRNFFK